MQKNKKYYGLARALSAPPVQLLSLYRSRRWTDKETDLIFGEKSTLEFLPDSEVDNPVPTYDYLGRYPDFVDQKDREYFITVEPQSATNAWIYIRIPRAVTIKTSAPSASYSDAIDLPRTGEKLELRLPKKHLASTPYVYDPAEEAIVYKEEPHKPPSLNTSSAAAACAVLETDSERRATARVRLRFTNMNDPFRMFIEGTYNNRAEILNVISIAAETLSAADFEEFCSTMMKFYS